MSDKPAVDSTTSSSAATAPPEAAVEGTNSIAVNNHTSGTSTEEKPLPKADKDAFEPAVTPLSQLFLELPAIVKEADHKEMWGVDLFAVSTNVPTSIVLEKFLRANTNDVAAARSQLTKALIWRKNLNPQKLLSDTEFDSSKFGGLGFVTTYKSADGQGKEIVTWNIYGAVKDTKATFGDVEEFIKWRSALMELSVKELDLPSKTVPIPQNGIDPYQMVQVHDYLNVSFLRMDPSIRAASKETIQTFSIAYPELLREKFFVNVPLVMGWVFAAMKLFLSPATIKKFHPLSYASNLADELPGWGDQLPEKYGGNGEEVEKGLKVKYSNSDSETATK